jgi:hypothetical protein
MTLAAVDRLVDHATIFEMNVESYRRRTAIQRSQGPGRPPARATVKSVILSAAARHKITLALLSRRDNHRQSRDRNFSS